MLLCKPLLVGGFGSSDLQIQLETSPVPSICTQRISSLFLLATQALASSADKDWLWQMSNVIISAFNVVPSGVKPKFVELTATRTDIDAGVDSNCTIRRLS